MLETLLIILAWDAPAAEIILGEKGEICLDWHGWYGGDVGATIAPSGGLAWAFSPSGIHLGNKAHGTDLDGLRKVLMGE